MSNLFVYKGNGSDGVKALPGFTAATGVTLGGAVDFIAFDSLTSMSNDAGWSIPSWRGKVPQLCLSVPLATNDVGLDKAASGALDAVWTQIAQLTVQAGFPTAYMRLGWEFNGGWYPWAFKGREQQFHDAFRRCVSVMRAVNAKFQYVWCPTMGMQQQWPDWTYPGDDVIDVIGLDVYNQSYSVDVTDTAALWNDVLNGSWGVQHIIDFAKAHGKPYAFPEFGTGTRPDGHGGGDDPNFMTQMAPLIAKAAFAGVWDFPAGDYNGLFSDGSKPKTLAVFKKLFGTPVTTAVPTTPKASVAPLTATMDQGGTVDVKTNADGSSVLTLNFPKLHYTIRLSDGRQVETWGKMNQLGWDISTPSAVVHVAAQ